MRVRECVRVYTPVNTSIALPVIRLHVSPGVQLPHQRYQIPAATASAEAAAAAAAAAAQRCTRYATLFSTKSNTSKIREIQLYHKGSTYS